MWIGAPDQQMDRKGRLMVPHRASLLSSHIKADSLLYLLPLEETNLC